MSDGEPTDSKVPLDLDEDKIEAWRRVKPDYEQNPDGVPAPNSMDSTDSMDSGASDDDDEGR